MFTLKVNIDFHNAKYMGEFDKISPYINLINVPLKACNRLNLA